MPSPALEERRPPITPQLAVRVAVLGGFAFVLFAIVFFRLWFLQVLSGEDYVSQARENRVRKVAIEAPRGDIVDRSGENILVKTRKAPVVQLLPNKLPEVELDLAAKYGSMVSAAERRRLAAGNDLRAFDRKVRRRGKKLTKDERRERTRLRRAASRADRVPVPPVPRDPELLTLFRRLSRVVDLPVKSIHRRVIQQIAQLPYAAVTVKVDVPLAAYNYIEERAHLFPGVQATKVYLREYPYDELGAQLFGTLREISPDELKLEDYRGLEPGARIGKDGVEETYDQYLRGEDGYLRQVVDANGRNCDDCETRTKKPVQGYRLRLTLDLNLQREANDALKEAVGQANANGYPSKAGAYVAMDPNNGEVLALGSFPSFDANLFAKPISQEKYDVLNSEASGQPLYNRAIAGVYPTGSTFKLITATAALESGLITPTTPIEDTGVFKLGPQEFKNARDAVFGTITLPRALQVSSDVFFYILGNRLNSTRDLQTWARRLGLGKTTGIDIPGEFKGLVPDAKYRNDGYDRYQKCVARKKLTPQTYAALLECGGLERPWSAGDNVNLSVGQGDLQATPLQMAVAYATMANGGDLVKPHLGLRVEDGEGRLIQQIEHPVRRRVRIKDSTRSAIMQGLRLAAQEGDGTSAHIFSGFGGGAYEVYGKTGTVERPGQADQSWYVAYVTNQQRTRSIVVAVTVEKGGFGAETAAPAACRIIARHFDLGQGECQPKDPSAAAQAD